MNGDVSERKAFLHGKVYTVNERQPLAEAVVVEGNKVIFTGSDEDAMELVAANTSVIDLHGRLMLPGFIDNHTHFIEGGLYLMGIDLRPARSTAEFREMLKNYVEKHEGQWITGGRWNHEAWEIKRLPTRQMIDDFTPNTPVFVKRLDGHMGLANSCALRLAGITKDTVSPEGGLIVRDETGEATGILKDSAMSLIYSVIPPPSEEQIYEAALCALREARENGITSVQNIADIEDVRVYQRLEQEGRLTCRMYMRMPLEALGDLIEKGIQAGHGSEKLKMGSLKAFADGSLGSSTAWFFENYEGASHCGLPMEIVSDGTLKKLALHADRNGLQLSVHAIGDRANAFILDMYADIKEKNPAWDRRFRIEHAQHVRFEDIRRFAEIGVIASAQPYHCIDDGVWAENKIGLKRTKYTYPFKSFLKNGVMLCFGSDWPVAPMNPIAGIYAAVTRRTLDDKNPKGWVPEQKIGIEEAIRCYTIHNAYAAFEEDLKGTIEPGKLADFVVLSDDILTIAPEKIRQVKVAMTVFDGQTLLQGL